MLLGPLALEAAHQLGHPGQLGPDVAHVLLDRGVADRQRLGHRALQLADPGLERLGAAGQLARPRVGLGAEPLAGHLDHRVDRGVDRRPDRGLSLGQRPGLGLRRPRPRGHAEPGGDDQCSPEAGPRAEDHGGDEQCGIHGTEVTEGV